MNLTQYFSPFFIYVNITNTQKVYLSLDNFFSIGIFKAYSVYLSFLVHYFNYKIKTKNVNKRSLKLPKL